MSHSMRRNVAASFISACAVLLFGLITTAVAADDSATTDAAEPEIQKASVARNMGLFGGQPQDIAADEGSDGVVMATFSPNGIFFSIDNGETWSGLPHDVNFGMAKAVEIDESTDTVYGLLGNTVIKTADGGTTVSELEIIDTTKPDASAATLGQAILLAYGRLLVAGVNGTVWISEDVGTTFNANTVESRGELKSLSASATTDTYFAVSQLNNSSEKLFKSTDGGRTWTDMSVHTKGLPSGSRFYEIAVDPLDDNHLVLVSVIFTSYSYQSTNGGATWSPMLGTGSPTDFLGAHATFDGTGRLYMGQYYSDAPTGNDLWKKMTILTPLSSIFADTFVVDPDNTNILFTNSSFSIAKSSDQGTSWEDKSDGVTAVKVYDVIQADDKDVVWIGANGGLAKTTNFQSASPDWEYPILPTEGLSDLKAVWIQPDNASVVVAGLQTFFSKTEDAGATWTQAIAPTFAGRVLDIVQSHVDANTLYAIFWDDNLATTDTGGVFMSTDAGATWTDLELPDNAPALSLAVSAEDTLHVGIGGDDADTGVYQYKDAAWTQLVGDFSGLKITSLLVDPLDATRIYLTAESMEVGKGFYVSTDEGATWTEITTGLEDGYRFDTLTLQTSTTPYTVYMAAELQESGNAVIYKSSDAGETWSLFHEGLNQELVYSMLFDGLLLGNDRGLYNVQTLATLELKLKKKTSKATLFTLTLKDSSTGKALADKKVRISRRPNKSKKWKKYASVKTDAQGKATVKVPVGATSKKFQLRASWRPVKDDAEEYTASTSSVLNVKR